jgi:hypothetical protein
MSLSTVTECENSTTSLSSSSLERFEASLRRHTCTVNPKTFSMVKNSLFFPIELYRQCLLSFSRSDLFGQCTAATGSATSFDREDIRAPATTGACMPRLSNDHLPCSSLIRVHHGWSSISLGPIRVELNFDSHLTSFRLLRRSLPHVASSFLNGLAPNHRVPLCRPQ